MNLKSYLDYLYGLIKQFFIFGYSLICLGKHSNGKNKVYFDIKKDYYHRYIYCLMKFFALKGYEVLIKARLPYLGRVHGKGRPELDEESFYVYFGNSEQGDLKFTTESNTNETEISPKYFKNEETNEYKVPMCMHPDIYKSISFDGKNLLKKSTTKVLLHGLCDSRYQKNILLDNFDVMSRKEIFKVIKSEFSGVIKNPKNLDDFLCYMRDTECEFIVSNKKDFFIPQNVWLKCLSLSDFFISPPGHIMPICHNYVEAMFSSTIPILEYNRLLSTPLTHEKNAVIFSGKSGLVEKMKSVLNTKEDKIDMMKFEVKKYYEENLSPDAVVSNIEKNYSNINTILLNAEAESVRRMKNNKFNDS